MDKVYTLANPSQMEGFKKDLISAIINSINNAFEDSYRISTRVSKNGKEIILSCDKQGKDGILTSEFLHIDTCLIQYLL